MVVEPPGSGLERRPTKTDRNDDTRASHWRKGSQQRRVSTSVRQAWLQQTDNSCAVVVID